MRKRFSRYFLKRGSQVALFWKRLFNFAMKKAHIAMEKVFITTIK